MIIRAIDAHLDTWIARRVTPPRSEGQHVSAILTDMLKSLPGNRYESWGKNSGNERHPMHEAGYAWEDVLAKALAERSAPGCHLLPPMELELDGIFGSPDRLIVEAVDGQPPRLIDEEIKFTWMSCKPLLRNPGARPTTIEDWITEGLTDDPKFSYWLLQAKTYAAMLWLGGYMLAPSVMQFELSGHPWLLTREDRGSPRGVFLQPPLTRLRALFINGAYRDELAIPGAFEIEWTPEELTSWWANVKAHAEQMRMRESPTLDNNEPIF